MADRIVRSGSRSLPFWNLASSLAVASACGALITIKIQVLAHRCWIPGARPRVSSSAVVIPPTLSCVRVTSGTA